MAVTVTLLAPAGNQAFSTSNGNSYVSDASGLIFNVLPGDVKDLLNDGCEFALLPTLKQVGALQAAATGSDYVVALLNLTANSFNAAGRKLRIRAEGSFAGNTHNKTIRLQASNTAQAVGVAIASGTVLMDSGVLATNGGGWTIGAAVEKYGAANSNTQYGFSDLTLAGATPIALAAPASLTFTENAQITLAVTVNAASATTDVTVNSFEALWVS